MAIPTYGGFQVTPTVSGAEGTRFRDFRSDLPNPNQQLGKDLNRLAGITLNVRDKADEARVQDKLTQLRKYAMDRRMGDNGFLKLHGENALKPDDEGQDLASREEAALMSHMEELAQDLTPRQRVLFSKGAQPIRTQQYGFAQQHWFNENEAYELNTWKNEGADAVNAATAGFRDMDVLADSEERARKAAAAIALKQGLDEKGTSTLVAESVGNVYAGALAGAIVAYDTDPSAVNYANAIREKFKDKIPAAKLVEFDLKINGLNDANLKNELATKGLGQLDTEPDTIALAHSALANGTAVSADKRKGVSVSVFGHIVNVESGGRQFEYGPDDRARTLVGRYADGTIPKNEEEISYGVSQMQVRNAKTAAQRLGIPFDMQRFKTDAAYNEALGQEFFSSLVEQYGGNVSLAVAAYHSGQGNVNKALKAAEKDGKPWVEHLGPEGQQYVAKVMKSFNAARSGKVTDASGKAISPLNPDYAQAHRKWATRKEMEDWAKANSPRAANDFNFREELVDEMAKRQSQRRADYEREQTSLMYQATDLVVQGKEVPQSLWAKMNTTQQAAVREVQRKMIVNDESGDLQLAMRATHDPTWWASLSPEAKSVALLAMPKEYRNTLDAKWYESRIKQAQGENAQALDNVRAQMGIVNPAFSVSLDKASGMLQKVLRARGMWPDDKDAQAFLELQLQRHLSKDAQFADGQLKEDSQYLSAVTNWVQQSVLYDGWSTSIKPLWELTTGDFPARAKTNAIEIVRQAVNNERAARGWHGEASDGEVIAKMQDVLFDRNVQLVWRGPDGMDIQFDAITKSYLEKQAGRKLGLTELLRAQALMELKGETVPEEAFNRRGKIEQAWMNAEEDDGAMLSGYRFNLDGGNGDARNDF